MHKPDIQLFKTDLTGVNPDNKINREYYKRKPDKRNTIFVPQYGPFYHDTVKLYHPNGEELDYGTDWEFFEMCGKLTTYTKNRSVGIYINLKNTDINECLVSYQTVGNFNLLTVEILDLLRTAIEDDRPVMWEDIRNKPLWFVPVIHRHDLAYDIHSFQDLIEQVKRFNELYDLRIDNNKTAIEGFQNAIKVYIDSFKKMIETYAKEHDSEKVSPYGNTHGLTALQVEMENVDNYPRATYLQALEGVRSDLHLTAENAKKAIEEAAGENNTLLPKGTLPIMRYGSNSFIPPGIDGSFEGLGGEYDFGVINKEPNGEYLYLGSRYNGQVEGLYFSVLKDPFNQVEMSFTGHRYTHPTADADGVNLTSVLNSTDPSKMIIVGNRKRNIWYWTETNGTFNPAKHVLKRITQEHVNTLIKTSTYNFVEPGRNNILIVDEYYKDRVYLLGYLSDNRYNSYASSEGKVVVAGNDSTANSFKIVAMFNLDSNWKEMIHNYTPPGETKKYSEKALCINPIKLNAQNRIVKSWANFSNIAEDNYFTEHYIYSEKRLFSVSKNKHETFLLLYCRFHMKTRLTSDAGNLQRKLSFKLSPDQTQLDFKFESEVDGNSDLFTWNTALSSDRSKFSDYLGGADASRDFYIKQNNRYRILYLGISNIPVFGRNYETDVTDDWNDLKTLKANRSKFDPFSYTEFDFKNPIGMGGGLWEHFPIVVKKENGTYISGFLYRKFQNEHYYFRRTEFINKDFTHKKPDYQITMDNRVNVGYYPENEVYKTEISGGVMLNGGIVENPGDLGSHLNTFIHQGVKCGGFGIHGRVTYNEYEFVKDHEFYLENNVIKRRILKKYAFKTLLDKLIAYAKTTYPEINTTNYIQWYQISSFVSLTGKLRYMITFYDGYTYTTKNELGVTNGNTATLRILFDIEEPGSFTTDSNGTKVYTITDYKKIHHSTLIKRNGTIDQNLFVDDRLSFGTVKFFTENNSYLSHQVQGKQKSTIVLVQTPINYRVAGNSHMFSELVEINEDGTNMTSATWTDNYKQDYQNLAYVPYWGYMNMSRHRSETGTASINGAILNRTVLENEPYLSTLNNNAVNGQRMYTITNIVPKSFTVYFKADLNIILSGNMYFIESTYIDLYSVDSNPANKTFYVYLKINENRAVYSIVKSPIPETPYQGLIAKVYTNKDAIEKIESFNVFTMNGFRISTDRIGSAIPAASGSINELGQTNGWGEGEDLL